MNLHLTYILIYTLTICRFSIGDGDPADPRLSSPRSTRAYAPAPAVVEKPKKKAAKKAPAKAPAKKTAPKKANSSQKKK